MNASAVSLGELYRELGARRAVVAVPYHLVVGRAGLATDVSGGSTIVPVSDADAAAMELDEYGPLEPPVGTALDGPMATAGKVFWRSEDGRIMTGVWEVAAGRMRADFGADGEMVHVVKGTIHARDDDGEEQTIGPGQSATFPPRWKGVWTLEAPMRKLDCTFKLGD